MYVITPKLYATPIHGSLNYAIFSRDGGTVRRVGTIKRLPNFGFTYYPARSKIHGEMFDKLADCLASLK